MTTTPTTAAQASVLTDVDALARECFKEFAVFQGRPTTFDDMEERHKETWRDNARNIIDRLTGAPTQTAQDTLIDALDKTGIPAAVERAREKAAPAATMPKIDDLVTPQIVKKAADAGERVGWETVLTPKAEIHHRVQDLQKYEAALKSVLPDILALFAKGGTP